MSDALNLEPKTRAFVDALAAANLPPFEAGTPEDARALTKALRPKAEPRPIQQSSDHAAPGPAGAVPIRRLCDVEAPLAAILYFHAGGWVLGSVEASEDFLRTLAIATGCAVYAADYRKAPEARFPAAADDAEAALAWLADDTDLPIVLMGESAGGQLAAVAAARARDAGGPRVALQILAEMVADASMDTESYRLFADGPLLTAALMAWFWEHYLPDRAARAHPHASPLRGDLAGLPRAFVLTAENDPLRDEGEAYAKALAAAGVSVECKRYAGQIHTFLSMGLSNGAAEALGDIAAAIRRVVG